ncbi:Ribosomal L18 of archaea, bacteria, mitoch. and chloroplast [Escherichia coli]|nr:Ribosomal L18 of archaea, bacteria, mitoch. and chloroplast [Escherichia coli]
MDKKSARIRRATRARRKLQELGATRLVVHRTPRHIYAQVIAPNGSEVLVAASTVEKAIAEQLKYTGNKDAAAAVGKAVAERALEKASKMYPLTVPGSNIMVVSRHWQMLPVKLAFSSKVEV